jgi:hypothetical protein
VLDDVYVHTGTKRARQRFPACPFDNLFHGEVRVRWPLTVQQSGRYPNLVSDFDIRLQGDRHKNTPLIEE